METENPYQSPFKSTDRNQDYRLAKRLGSVAGKLAIASVGMYLLAVVVLSFAIFAVGLVPYTRMILASTGLIFFLVGFVLSLFSILISVGVMFIEANKPKVDTDN